MTVQPVDCAVMVSRIGVFEIGCPRQVQGLSATNMLGFLRVIEEREGAFYEAMGSALGQSLVAD